MCIHNMSQSLLVWIYVPMSFNVKPILPIHGKNNIIMYIYNCYLHVQYMYVLCLLQISVHCALSKNAAVLSLQFHFNHCQAISSSNPYIDCPASLRAYHSALFLKRLVVLALIKKVWDHFAIKIQYNNIVLYLYYICDLMIMYVLCVWYFGNIYFWCKVWSKVVGVSCHKHLVKR